MPARLILEDGTVYDGEPFGATADAIGEVVFNTSLTGYQEIATDPSYRFQIVVMTYPHIGNYGVEHSVEQSDAPQVAGFVVRDVVDEPSSAHAQMSLGEYFEKTKVAAIAGLDTRALTRKIRTEGAMRGMITTDDRPAAELLEPLQQQALGVGLRDHQRVRIAGRQATEVQRHQDAVVIADAEVLRPNAVLDKSRGDVGLLEHL